MPWSVEKLSSNREGKRCRSGGQSTLEDGASIGIHLKSFSFAQVNQTGTHRQATGLTQHTPSDWPVKSHTVVNMYQLRDRLWNYISAIRALARTNFRISWK